jgi:hypothetical protein
MACHVTAFQVLAARKGGLPLCFCFGSFRQRRLQGLLKWGLECSVTAACATPLVA